MSLTFALALSLFMCACSTELTICGAGFLFSALEVIAAALSRVEVWWRGWSQCCDSTGHCGCAVVHGRPSRGGCVPRGPGVRDRALHAARKRRVAAGEIEFASGGVSVDCARLRVSRLLFALLCSHTMADGRWCLTDLHSRRQSKRAGTTPSRFPWSATRGPTSPASRRPAAACTRPLAWWTARERAAPSSPLSEPSTVVHPFFQVACSCLLSLSLIGLLAGAGARISARRTLASLWASPTALWCVRSCFPLPC